VTKPIWLIPQWLMANLPRKTGNGVLNLKHLLAVFPSSPLGSWGETKRAEADLVDYAVVDSKFAEESGQGFAESKGLANCVFAEP